MAALAQHPFLVWKDHRNLEYIRAAKRLNPHQARWAILFARFDFTPSYRPGSKNAKADALSRVGEKCHPLFPSPALWYAMWNADADIHRALRQEPPSAHCPKVGIYVPSDVLPSPRLGTHSTCVGETGYSPYYQLSPCQVLVTHLGQGRLGLFLLHLRHLLYGKLHPLLVPQRP